MKRVNKIIALYMGYTWHPHDTLNGIEGVLRHESRMSMHLDFSNPYHPTYHESWNELMPVWKKCLEIGLWMVTNNYDKLWLEKSKEIENAIIREFDCAKSATLISQLIEWYNKKTI